jgi:hypothetical protein
MASLGPSRKKEEAALFQPLLQAGVQDGEALLGLVQGQVKPGQEEADLRGGGKGLRLLQGLLVALQALEGQGP